MDPTVVSEVLTRQVATLMIGNATVAECAKQLAISPATVRTIQNSDKFKELVAAAAVEELAPALAKTKAQLARLSTKSVRVLEKAMDTYLQDGTGAREAIQSSMVALKATGLHEDENKPQEQTLTIIMPGAANPEPITYEVSNEDTE